MAEDNRPTFHLGEWYPPRPYDKPQLEPDAGIRTKEIEVLADATVVQVLGDNAETFVLRGDAFAEDIGELKEMRGETVEIRHSVHSGSVLVKNVSASSTGDYEEFLGRREWVYSYTVELIEAE